MTQNFIIQTIDQFKRFIYPY